MESQVWKVALLAGGAAVLLPLAYKDYNAYMQLGPGGLPHNVVGWTISNLLLKPLALGSNTTSTEVYLGSSDSSFLPDDFPLHRSGQRPSFSSHPVPHRQINQLPPADIRQKLMQEIARVGQTLVECGRVEIAASKMERHTDALFVAETLDTSSLTDSAVAAAHDTHREFAHVHSTGDHSLHVILSPADGIKVLQAGWGERHAFDGSRFARHVLGRPFPMTYILIYAPRTGAELDVVLKILNASVAYMTGHK